MTRPLIGVSTAARFTPAWPFLALSVWLAGGRPRRITPKTPIDRFDDVDGLIIGGGDDIGAGLYGAKAVLKTRIDPARDEAELKLLERFWRRHVPVLGICRGAQMLNVFRKGTLYQDIFAVYEHAPRMQTILPRKRVEITAGSRLRDVLGVDSLTVNSLHHQSVAEVGEDVEIVARDQNDIAQALELDGPIWRLGVQWHPEFLFYRSAHLGLFRQLVAQSRKRAALENFASIRI